MTPANDHALGDGWSVAWDCRCLLGEGPTWDARRGRLWFVDIKAGRLHGYTPGSGACTTWTPAPGEVLPSLGLCRSGRLVLSLRRSVVLFDPASGAVQPLAELPEPDGNRLNDGKVGPDGCFWVGGMSAGEQRGPTARLYRVAPDGGVEAKLDGLTISNSLAWSPDGRTLYHGDTHGEQDAGWIDAWDFDPSTGAIANRRRFATLADQDGRPDGAAMGRDGHLWAAGVTAGCLNRFAPDGTLVARVPVPVPAPTMPCLAEGAVWLTSLRDGKDEATLARYPHSGSLLRRPVDDAEAAPAYLFADTP